jgi:hypothetical protein
MSTEYLCIAIVAVTWGAYPLVSRATSVGGALGALILTVCGLVPISIATLYSAPLARPSSGDLAKLAVAGLMMGTGTDVAVDSASLTLLGGDLSGIVRARTLSRAVMRNIRQNLFFAFVYNSLGVPIAAGLAYPFFGLLLSPMLASAAMALSSVSVIGNALRLRALRL